MFCFHQNLPRDTYKLLAMPSPIGGVLVVGANTIHYHSQVDSFDFPILFSFLDFDQVTLDIWCYKFNYMLYKPVPCLCSQHRVHWL